MAIRKAVIPAAGVGTRMLPAAKAVPKELLPILDRPTIQYVVEEAARAGVGEVVFVTSKSKTALAAHFRADPDLAARLERSGRRELIASIEAIIDKVQIRTVDQPEQRGLGDAVYQAREQVRDQPFLCLLGDTVFSGEPLPAQQLMDAHARLGTAVIGLEEVPEERVHRYGIVGGRAIEPGVVRIEELIEKPSPQSAPSRLAIAARYVLTPAIFECLDETPPGKGGEIQLTDALNRLAKREPVHGIVLKAHRHDIGNPLDWLKTNLAFAARQPELWRQLSPLMKQLMEEIS